MDRTELRFRILFEYYVELHSEPKEMQNQANNNISKINVPEFEKNAAQLWLMDSGYVVGSHMSQFGTGVPHTIISRINNLGIDYVESVMNIAFTEIKDKFDGIEKLSKTERIQRFAKECLNYPISNEICKITYDAIVKFMDNAGS